MTPIAGKTNTRIRRVNQLVSRNPNEWNMELVREIFYPEDAECILKLKLPS
jgi:hypothetical protein